MLAFFIAWMFHNHLNSSLSKEELQPTPRPPPSPGRKLNRCLRRFFLAMAELKQVSLCSFGLSKKLSPRRSFTKEPDHSEGRGISYAT